MKIKKTNTILFIGLLLILSSFTSYIINRWNIEDGFRIHFSGNSVEGIFEKFKGEIIFNENALEVSNFSLIIEVESIATGNWLKNRHAKNDKWLDADKYPNITFKSTKFLKTAAGFAVKGILTIHGIQKEITIPFTFSNQIFKGNFSVNRMDYKIGNMEGMSKKVSNEIRIDFSVPVTRK
ncbi:YceI family protein [Flavobacterium sp. RS13.1]|uniref:YceI family protein n=1 Tax=Flavobacterium sp. RS13.1 TaxID=3400345 RepID=UPI003AAC90C6